MTTSPHLPPPGKTATFSIAILQKIDTGLRECQALILAPTRYISTYIHLYTCTPVHLYTCTTALPRELAQQIQKVVMSLGDYMGAQCHACIGGTSVRFANHARCRSAVALLLLLPLLLHHLLLLLLMPSFWPWSECNWCPQFEVLSGCNLCWAGRVQGPIETVAHSVQTLCISFHRHFPPLQQQWHRSIQRQLPFRRPRLSLA